MPCPVGRTVGNIFQPEFCSGCSFLCCNSIDLLLARAQAVWYLRMPSSACVIKRTPSVLTHSQDVRRIDRKAFTSGVVVTKQPTSHAQPPTSSLNNPVFRSLPCKPRQSLSTCCVECTCLTLAALCPGWVSGGTLACRSGKRSARGQRRPPPPPPPPVPPTSSPAPRAATSGAPWPC